jgi:CRISPR system Cascade subunit CasC
MPDSFLGVVRDSGAWNLANAFLKPVTGNDLMATSTARLTEHFTQLRAFYGTTHIRGVTAASVSGDLPNLDPTEITTSVDDFTSRLLTTAKA